MITVSANTAQGGRGGDGGGTYDANSVRVLRLGGHGGNGGGGAFGVGGAFYVAGGMVTLANATVSTNHALGGWLALAASGDVSSREGLAIPGLGQGGGLSIAPAAPPLADLDTFTESNTVNNTADADPNISGPSSVNGGVPSRASASATCQPWKATPAPTRSPSPSPCPRVHQTVTVAYATADGTATAGSDYQPRAAR